MTAKEKSMSDKELNILMIELGKAIDQFNLPKITELLISSPIDFNPSHQLSDLLWMDLEKNQSYQTKEKKLRLVTERAKNLL